MTPKGIASLSADSGEAGSLEQAFPAGYKRHNPQHSGKVHCLKLLLGGILGHDDADRVVVVSNSTAALDLIQTLCNQQGYSTVRIDGATDVNKRQDIVNSFNNYCTAQVRRLQKSSCLCLLCCCTLTVEGGAADADSFTMPECRLV